MLSLSLDGGGVRGALQCAIIANLDDATSFLGNTAAFSGTSIGSFAAAALAFGVRPHDLVNSFHGNGEKIFQRNLWNKITSPFGATKAKYGNDNIKELVYSYFGNQTFGDLKQKKLLIPTFGLNVTHKKGQNARPQIYSNIGERATLDKLVAEAVLESMAAPVYFPTINNSIDGGVYANNPSTSLLSELLRFEGNQEEIWMLSVGTGANPIKLDLGEKPWGLMDWVLKGHLLPILMGEATTGANHYYSETILGERYCRIQPYLDGMIELDAYEDIPKLIQIGLNVDITESLQFLHNYRKAI